MGGEHTRHKSGYLLRTIQEQQEIIEKQSKLIAELVAVLENWKTLAGYDGEELKERARELQEKGRYYENDGNRVY